MAQQEVYQFLKKNDRWYTSKEISKNIGIQFTTISNNLAKMYKYKEVLRRRVKIEGHFNYEYRLTFQAI